MRADAYPYLHAARRTCMPYAHVLAIVEAFDRQAAGLSVRAEALTIINGLKDRKLTLIAIHTAYANEKERQKFSAACPYKWCEYPDCSIVCEGRKEAPLLNCLPS